MRKIFALLFCMILGSSVMYAGTWVVGVNQVDRFLKAVELGTGNVPPTVPLKTDGTINTDYGGIWDVFPGITCTPQEITGTTYLEHSNTNNHWRGFLSINYANKGYKQKAGTEIKFVQPSTQTSDYAGVPEGYSNLGNYFDRNDLSWLQTINLSGNDLNNIVIDGGPYKTMPLKNIDLSNNPNLTSVSIVNCTGLLEVNLTGTGLTPQAFETVKAGVLASSPNANVYMTTTVTGIGAVTKADLPVVKVIGNKIRIENKKANDVVNIFNVSGQKQLETTEESIDASSFGKGLFIVRINNFVTKIRI